VAGLGLVGIAVFLRMLMRNDHTERCKHGLDLIRQAWKDRSAGDHLLLGYHPLAAPDAIPTGGGSRKPLRYASEMEPRKFGGLAHSTAIVNSILAGVSAWFLSGAESRILIAVIAFTAFFFLQIGYAIYRDIEIKKDFSTHDPTHSCAVARKREGKKWLYLVVQAKESRDYVLPSGKIEKHEGHAEAALRELKEEARWVAKPLAYLGCQSFDRNGKTARMKYYLMEALYKSEEAPAKGEEQRHPKWLTFDKTITALAHVEAKQALMWAKERA
jgi:8-oxo-dGTP pyrophosphatase MutT (NUDIX family)